MTSGALPYLTAMSLRNRLLAAGRRLRNPRYAAAIILGLIYIWFSLVRPTSGGAEISHALLGTRTELVISLAILLYVIFGWFSSNESRSLAFTEAEVHFLFSAPLSRRALVGYKITRSQLLIALNALIWVFVLRRGGGEGLPAIERYLAVWIVLSNVSLQRLGSALVRVSFREHGRTGAWRQKIPLSVLLLVLVALGVVVARAVPSLEAASGAGAMLDVLAAAFSAPLAVAVLFPVRIAVAPVFSHSTVAWAVAMWPALVLAAVQVWWVLRVDAAFEEAAVQASVERARRIQAMRSGGTRGIMAPKKAKRSLSMPRTGPRAGAIVWKNALCLMRTGQVTSLISVVIMAGSVTAVLAPAQLSAGIALFGILMAGLLFFLGTRLLRVDLRQDMLHLEALKALPLDGRSMVAAEIASATLPIAALQFALVVVAFVAAAFVDSLPLLTPATRVALLVASPLVLLALDAATVTIQNAAALLFPSWVRLGTHRASGIETLGQGILTTFGSLLVLVVALVPPTIVAGIVLLASGGGALAEGGAAIGGSIVLLGEVWWAVGRLGRAFEKTEPSQVV